MTCDIKFGVNQNETEGVIPKIPIILRHAPIISIQKPIDRCRSVILPLDGIFLDHWDFCFYPINSGQTYTHKEQLCF